MVSACSPIPTGNPLPGSHMSKGDRAQFSKGGRALTTEYRPHAGSQHSFEAPNTGSHDLTHSCAICPYIPCHPRCLVFGNNHSPRVVSKPQKPLLPPAALVLLVREPIAHCTRSRVSAPFALFASRGRYHECIQYRIPTAKSLHSPLVALGFADLCAMHHMTTAETTILTLYALPFCTRTTHWPCQSLTLKLAICWSIANSDVILGTKPHGRLHMPMNSAGSAKALAHGRPPASSM